jgi:hypothetical protein
MAPNAADGKPVCASPADLRRAFGRDWTAMTLAVLHES